MSPSSAGRLRSLFPERSRCTREVSFMISGGIRWREGGGGREGKGGEEVEGRGRERGGEEMREG